MSAGQTPTGLAIDLDSARLLNSPEHAARVAELEENLRAVNAGWEAARARVAELEARLAEHEVSPLAWARLLDEKSLDNFMISLGMAADTDPAEGALSQVEEMIRSFRAALPHDAEAERTRTLHDHIVARDAEIERLRARLAEYERPADEDPIAYALTEHAEVLADRYRAEVLAEVTTWLVKKAREFRAMGGEMRAAQADAVAAMASKVERGAVRPDNLRMLPAGFFEPGHAYTHRPGPDDLGGPRLRFYCESVTTDKATGQPVARGWGGRRYGDRWTSVQRARGLEDWQSGAWVDTTTGGDDR